MYSVVITTQKVSPFYGQNVMGHLHKTLWILIMSGESIKVFGSRIDFLFFTSEQFRKKDTLLSSDASRQNFFNGMLN